jgi:hypothetical protein
MWQKSIAIMEDCFIISEYEEETATGEENNINCIDNNNLAVKLADNFKNKLKLQLADHFSENNNNHKTHRHQYLQSLGK